MSSNGRLLGVSLILLATAAALVFVGLGQYRSYDQALRLCEDLRKTTADLQAAIGQLAQASGGTSSVAPARHVDDGSGAPSDARTSSYTPPIQDVSNGDDLKTYTDELVRRNKEQHDQDTARFGVELTALYKEALDEEGAGSRETNRAFGELVEKYPEANVTGMAIANRGLLAAMKQRTEDVEMFRNMLSRKEQFKRIVTDSHIDAYPSLLGYLANRYVMDGRAADAEKLLAELAKDFPKSYVAVGGFGSKPMLVTVDRFSERVRAEAKGPPKPPDQPQPPREGASN